MMIKEPKHSHHTTPPHTMHIHTHSAHTLQSMYTRGAHAQACRAHKPVAKKITTSANSLLGFLFHFFTFHPISGELRWRGGSAYAYDTMASCVQYRLCRPGRHYPRDEPSGLGQEHRLDHILIHPQLHGRPALAYTVSMECATWCEWDILRSSMLMWGSMVAVCLNPAMPDRPRSLRGGASTMTRRDL